MQLITMYALLLHAISVPNGDRPVFQTLVIDGNAQRCAYGVLAAVSFSNGILLIKGYLEVKFEVTVNALRQFWQAVLFHQWKDCSLGGSERVREAQYGAAASVGQGLFL